MTKEYICKECLTVSEEEYGELFSGCRECSGELLELPEDFGNPSNLVVLRTWAGVEPECPECGNWNAMLNNHNPVGYKCRDCGYFVAKNQVIECAV